MTPLIWTGSIPDLSGYGSAARGYIHSILEVGGNVSADFVSFEPWISPFLSEKIVGRKIFGVRGKENNARVHVIHLTPDLFFKYSAGRQYKVGYFAWETSKLPMKWVPAINNYVQEIWVPAKYIADVSKNSGVKIPIRVLPHAIPLPSEDWEPSYTLLDILEDTFIFYSISQWSERKNFLSLVRAFYEEFSGENVALLLKTYLASRNPNSKMEIRKLISGIKKECGGINCPPVYLVEDFLNPNEIQSLNYYGNCYISMARSEGFGMGAFEAAAFGNPVIVPNYSSFPEHFNEDNSYLIDVFQEVPCSGMTHISPLYTPDMKWGNPSIDSCKRRMREVFENQEKALVKGQKGKEYVKKYLSYKTIGQQIMSYVEGI